MVDTVVLAMDLESIQMLITPAKCNLQRVVQVSNSAIAANQQAAPDHWTDLANPYMQPIDLDCRHGIFHDAGQFSGLVPLCHPQPPVCPTLLIGLSDDLWGERVTAVVVAQRPEDIDVQALQTFCRERLAGFKTPKTVLVQDVPLPRTATGKVQKFLLVEQFPGSN
jgi:hypothetical protein